MVFTGIIRDKIHISGLVLIKPSHEYEIIARYLGDVIPRVVTIF